MKAITLIQPWATLVAIGAKQIETRSWQTTYRGPLAIHAAAGYGKGGKRGFHSRCQYEPFLSALEPHLRIFDRYNVFAAPMGAIIATCDLIDCRKIPAHIPVAWGYSSPEQGYEWQLTDQERAFGDYTPGRFVWLLANVRALPAPIPAKGALSLWEAPDVR